MIQAITSTLTLETFSTLSISDIVFFEFAYSGAMGNAGGLIFHTLKNEQLYCYQTDIFSDRDLFHEVSKRILKHQNELEHTGPTSDEILFHYCYGGMGNHVLINKKINLKKHETALLFKEGDFTYQIECSVVGVLNGVAYYLENILEKDQ